MPLTTVSPGVMDTQATATWRNRIINGDMRIDQRNNGASVTIGSGTTYTLDRWVVYTTQASRMSVQRNAGSVTPPTGYNNYLGVTSLSAYSVLASDFFVVAQPIEGFNVADLGWGAAGAAFVTLSFWVRSSVTGSYAVRLVNSAGTRNYLAAYTVNSANTWEQKFLTVPGDTTGAWLTDNQLGINVQFPIGVGSSFQGAAGAWSSTVSVGVTGGVNVLGTNGATFYITGVQLEAGTAATAFERRDYGRELMLCQRYFFTRGVFYVNCLSTTDPNARITLGHPVMTRAAPTATASMAVGTFVFDQVSTIQATYGAFSVGAGNFGLINSVSVSAEL